MEPNRAATNHREGSRRISYIVLTSLILLMVSVVTIAGVSGYVGWNLTHPVRQQLSTGPGAVGMAYRDVVFNSRGDGVELRGWFIPAQGSSKTVIFAHGFRQNRLEQDVPVLSIARALSARQYNILMFDFRNSGESGGSMTSVGQYEVEDLLGAVDYIRAQPSISQQIVLFGFSMGAATSILAGAREPEVTAVIADSPFADLQSYLEENLCVWTELPAVPFNQAFFWVVPALTGLKAETVSPVQEIDRLNGRPVLLIHGEADADIPVANSEILQTAYPQARLLKVPGAAHVKSFATAPEEYMEAVNGFLQSL